MRLSGRTALVTAGSSGIGFAVAQRLQAAGAAVFLSGHTEERTKDAAAVIGASGSAVTELADPGSVDELVREALVTMGRIDILVSNTGGPRPGSFLELFMDDWENAYRLILDSAIRLTRGVLPAMMDAGWGRLIYLTSSGVTRPLPGLHLSNVLRAGVDSLARSLVSEIGRSGVATHVVAPAHVDTERYQTIVRGRAEHAGRGYQELLEAQRESIPAGRLGSVQDVASLIAFLASDDSSYLMGQTYLVDGGSTQVTRI